MFRAVQLGLAQAGDPSAGFIQQLYLSRAFSWDREEAEETVTAVTQPSGVVLRWHCLFTAP